MSCTVLVTAYFLGVACGGSGSDDGSTGSGAQAGSGSGGEAGLGGRGTGGGSGIAGASGSGGDATGGSGGGSGGSGTGGTGATGDLPHIPPETLVSDLDDEQKAELCDWIVGLFGGYDVTTECTVGSVKTFPSQELCIQAGLSFTCQTVTVGDVEACNLSQVPSGGCDRSDPSCLPLHCM
jgi:hypothetical protein